MTSSENIKAPPIKGRINSMVKIKLVFSEKRSVYIPRSWDFSPVRPSIVG